MRATLLLLILVLVGCTNDSTPVTEINDDFTPIIGEWTEVGDDTWIRNSSAPVKITISRTDSGVAGIATHTYKSEEYSYPVKVSSEKPGRWMFEWGPKRTSMSPFVMAQITGFYAFSITSTDTLKGSVSSFRTGASTWMENPIWGMSLWRSK